MMDSLIQALKTQFQMGRNRPGNGNAVTSYDLLCACGESHPCLRQSKHAHHRRVLRGICTRTGTRLGAKVNADVWDVQWRWAEIRPKLKRQLLAGTYRLGAVELVKTAKKSIELWAALDALVLKAVAFVLSRRLGPMFSRICYHLLGHGGAKRAVRDVADQVGENTFVFRTDVKRYYASVDHDFHFAQLKEHIDDPRLLDLLWQYMRRTIYDRRLYEDVTVGIPLGCALSPLMGAVYPKPIDDAMATAGFFFTPASWTTVSCSHRLAGGCGLPSESSTRSWRS